ACTECKRRKVKCDGTEPCFYCRWYKHPERCAYPQPAPRPSLTRKSLDTLRSRLANSTDVLKRLFPTSTLDDLVPLSREALLALLDNDQSGNHSPTATPTAAVAAPASSTDINISQSPEGSRGSRDFEYNESIENLEETEAVADDVNALFLKPDRTSSYVGASSATAGLRTLLKIAPDLRFIKPKLPHRANSQESNNNLRADPSQVIERSGESRAPRDLRSLVDAYFWHVHSSTPILDEFQFRTTFESRERKDPTWFALLHMVCALGTIAHTTSDSNEDIYHYKIAKSYLSLDSFGSGHIDTLQALILMAGWYLHYRNRPNMASALMGAVFRMAHALGLHKELPGNETARDKHQRELRRRIWWSLVVLDTGEGTTLGRVSKTELFNSEVKLPRNINDHVRGLPRIACSFSRQASKIQERLISSPCLEFNETLALDAHLVYWFESIPFLNNPELLPECLQQPRLSTKWKYQNLRIILHRPTLMEATLRHIPFQELQGEQKVCVRKCQSLAGKAIENIASEWTQNQYSGWPAVWFLFQACTIPLLSLYGFNDDLENTEGWKKQVERAIKLFEEMKPWSIAAHQTHVFVSLLYE
ncbi:fungal-specific transcription factor domain-containing protein, partial [Talaromyces proteolyticus]